MSTTRHFYIRDNFGRGLATVAYRQSFTNRNMVVEYGASFCHPTDQFNRMEGRNMATKRIQKKLVLPEDFTANQVIQALLKKVMRTQSNCPRRVRKAIKERLRQVSNRPREINGNRAPAEF